MRKLQFEINDISFLLIFILAVSCESWNLPQSDFPTIITGFYEVEEVLPNVTLLGEVSDLMENRFVDNHGHVWSKNNDDSLSVENNQGQTFFGKLKNGTFQSYLEELTPGKTYYYRAYLIINNETQYGEIKSFTLNTISPTLTIDSVFTSGDKIYNITTSISGLKAGVNLSSYGITWGSDSLPSIQVDQIIPEQGIVVSELSFQFESQVELRTERIYIRPYLVIGDSAYYGDTRKIAEGDIWVRKADFLGGRRWYSFGFSVGEKGYVGTGLSKGNTNKSDFWEYDSQTDTWNQLTDFPGGIRSNAVSFSIGDKGYVGTGANANSLTSDFWEYDPHNDVWTRLTDFGGGSRRYAVAFSIGNKGYLGTGWDGINFKSDFWEYDPQTDTWTRLSNFGGGNRLLAVGFSIRGKGYIGTGWNENNSGTNDFWEYDPISDIWSQKASINGVGRYNSAGFSIMDKGYIGVGRDVDNVYRKDFWEYDPERDIWTQRQDYNEPVLSPFTFSIDKKGYWGAGTDITTARLDLWEYTPK